MCRTVKLPLPPNCQFSQCLKLQIILTAEKVGLSWRLPGYKINHMIQGCTRFIRYISRITRLQVSLVPNSTRTGTIVSRTCILLDARNRLYSQGKQIRIFSALLISRKDIAHLMIICTSYDVIVKVLFGWLVVAWLLQLSQPSVSTCSMIPAVSRKQVARLVAADSTRCSADTSHFLSGIRQVAKNFVAHDSPKHAPPIPLVVLPVVS